MPMLDGLDGWKNGVTSVPTDANSTSPTGQILSTVATESGSAQTQAEMEQTAALSPIVSTILTRYETARYARKPMEQIWLQNMLQWRGVFTPEEADAIRRSKERNVYAAEMFIKITKTKVTAALGQIIDLVLDNDQIPIRIEPADHQDEDDLPLEAFIAPQDYPGGGSPYGYPGDGQTIRPGANTTSVVESLYSNIKSFLQNKKIIKGASPDPHTMPELSPAEEAADKMEKVIIAQMEEGDFKRELRSALWECVVLGTGIIKGPMTYERVEHKWEKQPDPSNQDGKPKIVYTPDVKYTPSSYYVSCWNFYPDPNATRPTNMGWCIEKHLLNASGVSDLKRIEGFDSNAIDRLIYAGAPTRQKEYWEPQIRDINQVFTDDRYEILEYWGYLERDMINTLQDALGRDLLVGADQFQVNVWICNNEILRLVINPFVPARIPYYPMPYEEHTQQIWGISIPENMKDVQMLMNGHYRMMVDNLALAGNCVFEVNENYLSPGQDLTMYPGKVIRTNNGAPGQSIFSLSFNNTAQSHMQAYQMAKQTADEVTGQPSYSYGGASTTGANRTASGISMLMGAAAGNIRQVVKQCDEYVFRPLGEAYFQWNMQYNDDADVCGNVDIIAGGTAALMRREVMSQRLLQFAQAVGANPAIAPRVNWDEWVREFAKSMNLDPDKFLNDQTAAMLAAQMMGAAQGQGSGQPPQPGSGGAPTAAGGPQDQTGGGGSNIAPGMPTVPGETSSSNNVQQGNS